jgi:hypothetical protein
MTVGLMADAAFVNRNHAGVTADAVADMQLAINTADTYFRGSNPTANGSVPLTLAIGPIVAYTSETQQELDGIHSCPTMICERAGVNNPGAKCDDVYDCIIGSTAVECIEEPGEIATCSSGTYKGKVCFGDFECPGSTCSGPEVPVLLCDGDPTNPATADGRLCQTSNSNCSLFGNCCPAGTSCNSTGTRAAQAAGRYRTESGNSISTTNSGSIHLFTGCNIYQRGVSNGHACGTLAAGSWSLSEHPKACALSGQDCISAGDCATGTGPCTPASALADVSLVAHELGHTAGANHDDSVGACGPLRITEKACLAGTAAGKMCVATCASNVDCVRLNCTLGSCQDCPGSTCTALNRRVCSGSGNDCFVDTNCASGETCGGPLNKLCVGGLTPGSVCNASHTNECPGDLVTPAGTCTGAPMNWHIYLESGSYSKIGGFSPCSRAAILSRINAVAPLQPPTCYTNVDCGDLNRSGSITSGDASAALRMSVGLGISAYDDLADVLPTTALGGPNGSVTAADASLILQLATGTGARPEYCGTEDAW